MRRSVYVAAAAVALGVVMAANLTGGASGEGAKDSAKVADLAWLEGSWTGKADDGAVWEAVYTAPSGGEVVSASKEMKDGKVAMFDFERFFEKGGKVVMVPFPWGRQSVEFPLTEFDAAARRAVFENPAHDFPRRFRYERVADDKLEIELAGDMGGNQVKMAIRLTRRD